MKNFLSKITKLCSFCALLTILHACDNSPYVTEILLRANFDTDNVGYLPNKSLPGAPIGDEMVYGTNNNLLVVNSPFSGGQSALLQKTDNLPIEYISRNSSFSGIVTLSWNGRLVNWLNNSQVLYIEITNGQGNIVVKFAIAGQSVFIQNINDPFSAFQGGSLLGSPFPRPNGLGDAATDHVMLIDINYAQKKFDLSIIGQNFNPTVFKLTGLPVYNPNLAFPINGRPALKIRAYNGATSGSNHGFIIDQLTISRKFIPIPDF